MSPPNASVTGPPLRALPRAKTAAAGYGVALAAVTASVLFRYALHDSLGLKVPYLQFYPAILVAAWFGGLGPGVLATALGGLVAMYFLLPPAGFAVGDATDLVSLAVFLATGLAIAWLNHRLHATEIALRASAATATARAERLDTVLNTTVDGIIVIDARGRIEAFNPGAERVFGYPESEVVGRNVSLLMPSPHHEEHDKYLERYLTTGEAKIIGIGREVTGRRRDGTSFPLHLSVGEMHIAGERKFTGLLHDLTKRATLGAQLQASEARWRAVIESAADGIIVIDGHGRIEAFNPGAARLFGHAEHEVLGQNVDLLMPSPYHEEHDAYLARYQATGRSEIIGRGREVTGLHKDGTTFPVHLSVGEIALGGERKFTGILHDLRDRVAMETQLREQATLARLGEMAAVIAHEVKNPLAGIRGAIQVVGTRLPAENPSVPILKEIVARIDALDQMMKELLLFARPPKPRWAPTDVVSLVANTAEFLSQDPSFSDVEFNVTGSAPSVAADASMLKIAFQNLLLNSAHAMQGKGHIHVDVTNTGGLCKIAFIDSGPGIPAEIQDKIFTPFFTTKSRGSGLGLPTAKRMIEAQNGQIAIECPATGGTTVLVCLPLDASSQG